MPNLLTEITPLSEKDCFYIVERHKSEFLFPLHRHRDFELNFIENGRGVRRVVGDSVEEIGDFELTLVAGEALAHAWEQGSCTSPDVREITIQFAPELFSPELLGKNQFSNIHPVTYAIRIPRMNQTRTSTMAAPTSNALSMISVSMIPYHTPRIYRLGIAPLVIHADLRAIFISSARMSDS